MILRSARFQRDCSSACDETCWGAWVYITTSSACSNSLRRDHCV